MLTNLSVILFRINFYLDKLHNYKKRYGTIFFRSFYFPSKGEVLALKHNT